MPQEGGDERGGEVIFNGIFMDRWHTSGPYFENCPQDLSYVLLNSAIYTRFISNEGLHVIAISRYEVDLDHRSFPYMALVSVFDVGDKVGRWPQ